MTDKPVQDSVKTLIAFEEAINYFLLDMESFHTFSIWEDDILNATKRLRKRIQKMREFRETFK